MLATAVVTVISIVLAFLVGAGLLPPRFQEESLVDLGFRGEGV